MARSFIFAMMLVAAADAARKRSKSGIANKRASSSVASAKPADETYQPAAIEEMEDRMVKLDADKDYQAAEIEESEDRMVKLDAGEDSQEQTASCKGRCAEAFSICHKNEFYCLKDVCKIYKRDCSSCNQCKGYQAAAIEESEDRIVKLDAGEDSQQQAASCKGSCALAFSVCHKYDAYCIKNVCRGWSKHCSSCKQCKGFQAAAIEESEDRMVKLDAGEDFQEQAASCKSVCAEAFSLCHKNDFYCMEDVCRIFWKKECSSCKQCKPYQAAAIEESEDRMVKLDADEDSQR